ncbi:MAG: hypothetical protein GY803_11310 [Chloroflexi bacterium]|nr:hypothetical protein [Chloroflexota bacterium]
MPVQNHRSRCRPDYPVGGTAVSRIDKRLCQMKVLGWLARSTVVEQVDRSADWFSGHADGRVPMIRVDTT